MLSNSPDRSAVATSEGISQDYVVAEAFPGAERVPALARQATWRDIGAGTGPLAAGVLFPVASTLSIYAGAGLLLASATLLLVKGNR